MRTPPNHAPQGTAADMSDKTFDPQTAFARFRRVFSASFSFYGWFAGYFSRANSRRLR